MSLLPSKQGNEKFSAGDLKGAARCYRNVLPWVQGYNGDDIKASMPFLPTAEAQPTYEQLQEVKALQLAVHTNLSTTLLQLDRPKDVSTAAYALLVHMQT